MTLSPLLLSCTFHIINFSQAQTDRQIKMWEDDQKKPLNVWIGWEKHACVCQKSGCLRMLFYTPHPFILGEQGNEEEVMASEQEACTSQTATAVVFCCCHSLFHSDCLPKLWSCSPSALNHLCVDDERCRICLIREGSKVQIKHVKLITCTPLVIRCSVISHQRWSDQSWMGMS